MITGNFNTAGKILIRIVDVNGRVVKKLNETVTQGFSRIRISNIENLNAGIYIIETDKDNVKQKLKLVKLD